MQVPRIISGTLAKDWNEYKKDVTTVALCTTLFDKEWGPCSVALPNPVPAYLSIAQNALQGAKEIKSKMVTGKTMFPSPVGRERLTEFVNLDGNQFDEYFQISCVIVVTAVMSLEAWANQMIPDAYVYEKESNSGRKKFNKDDIQRWISLDEKISEIIPTVSQKPSFKGKDLWQRYRMMIDARDDFTHLKFYKSGQNPTGYDTFFQKIFSLDLDEIVKTPEEVMRYFVPKDLGF